MQQRKVYPPNKDRKPHKFIPRRDLFPDDDYILPNKPTTVKDGDYQQNKFTAVKEDYNTPNKHTTVKDDYVQQNKFTAVKDDYILPNKPTAIKRDNKIDFDKHQKKNKKSSKPTVKKDNFPIPLILLFGILIYSIWQKKESGTVVSDLNTAVNNVIDNPNHIDLLRTIGPYLEDKEQDIVYSAVGVLEAASILKSIMNHTYHQRVRAMSRKVPSEPVAKRIEMLKVLKPYIPDKNKEAYNNVLKIIETTDKLNRNIEVYKNNRILSDKKRLSPIENIYEIANVLKPIIPEQYIDKANKVMTVMRMAEALNSSDGTSGIKKSNQSLSRTGSGKSESTSEASTKGSESGSNAEKMIGSLKSMLNDEQKQSVDMIMKMAQLLSQPSEDNDSEDITYDDSTYDDN